MVDYHALVSDCVVQLHLALYCRSLSMTAPAVVDLEGEGLVGACFVRVGSDTSQEACLEAEE